MKSLLHPRNGVLRENRAESGSPSFNKQRPVLTRRQKLLPKENTSPSDLNSSLDPSPSTTGKHTPSHNAKIKSPLPPRPPPPSKPNCLKRKFIVEPGTESNAALSDSGVKVIIRIRPPNKDREEEGDEIVQKLCNDTLSVLGQNFTFDSIADTDSTQSDIFDLVGAPLVQHCLAGFNSSVFAYGQTGSGKTYTMWGPANALSEGNKSNDQQGLTPRVLHQLFSQIKEEQIKNTDKQLKHQCRCSFLEIYNEQISDLLDPSQKNLQIREDVNCGVYVENLTEEYVCSMKDVIQFLIKGLSNRRTGSTNVNSDSSRSHIVFTCVVESRCKNAADGMNSCRTSRINLVDLAGSERQKITGAAGERLKEAGNINRSLSQLGNLMKILAEVSQTGKQRHVPYRDSRLTFLLQESLGGNAKLSMVFAVNPVGSCQTETLSTLRFAQRAKAIKNKPIVNEIMQDDVNVLREVIQQLKDELVRIKGSPNGGGGSSAGWNPRRSLNILKFSLNHPTTLPHIDDDSDEEMEIDDGRAEPEPVTPPLATVPHEEREQGEGERGGSSVFKSPTATQRSHERLAARLHRGLEIIETCRRSSVLAKSSFRFPVLKQEIGIQTTIPADAPSFCAKCSAPVGGDEDSETLIDSNTPLNTQLITRDDASGSKSKKSLVKAVEKVVTGSIRRELQLEGLCAKQASEIAQLHRLVQQYREERECNRIISRLREDKILRLKLPADEFAGEELAALQEERDVLRKKYENHPEVSRVQMELRRAADELERRPSFSEFEEREQLLVEEIHDLRNQLLCYIDGPAAAAAAEAAPPPSQCHLEEEENTWMSVIGELRSELAGSLSLVEDLKQEVDSEKKCSEELKEAMQLAMEVHARMLEQYADLEERHMHLLARNRRIQERLRGVK